MEKAKTGQERKEIYTKEYSQLKKALKEELYLEAVSIGYAVIEDRLVSFLHHAGIVSRNVDSLKINRVIYPYMRRLLNKDYNYSIRIKNISVKRLLINALLSMSESDAKRIDDEVSKDQRVLSRKLKIANVGYMQDLYEQLNKNVDKELVHLVFKRIDGWRVQRNQLVHALLSCTVKSSEDVMKQCANVGYNLTREIDNQLVKPFKKSNLIRRKYRIQ